MANDSQSYLTFSLGDLIYGIEIFLVKEIFQLPELTIIPETPEDIIGVLYLRDRTIPVMHLARRLGQPVSECTLDDRVIVIQWQTIEIGVIVNEVLDVVSLDYSSIESEPTYGRENHINTAFIANIAKIADRSTILINPETLIRQPDAVIDCIDSAEVGENWSEIPEIDSNSQESKNEVRVLGNFFELYCPSATEVERNIFRQRAKQLHIPLDTGETTGTIPLAIFTLGEEYFGCDLDVIKEFIDLEKVTPIPCCPRHIVGNINLRGEIITLIDIRSVLNFAEPEKPSTQAIVVQIDDIQAGIVVDEIFDVLRLDGKQLTPTVSGVAAEIKPYFQGMALYENNVLSALDLPKIFAEGNLVVG